MSSENSELSLPPNVSGRKRGSIELNLCELRWKSTKSYPSVKIHIFWWGQSQYLRKNDLETNPTVLKWIEGKPTKPISYKILTNLELFKKYLVSSEPILIKLISTKTNLLIGTTSIQLPQKITTFPLNQRETICRLSNLILSPRNFNLGEIVIDFKVTLDQIEEEKEVPQLLRPLSQRNSVKVKKVEAAKDLKIEGETMIFYNLPEKKKPFRSLLSNDKERVLKYLSGKPLKNVEENSTLSEICSISPAESMIEALNKFTNAPADKKRDLLKSIDTVKIFVQNLKLTKAGIKEIFHKSDLCEADFMIKCKITDFDSSKLRFYSSSAVNDTGEIEFKSEVISSIVLLKESQSFYFEFCIYLYNLKKLVFLGSARVKLEELLNKKLSCFKRCPVKLAGDDILLGNLIVKIELGNKGLHFGHDFIDAIMYDKENRTISPSDEEEAFNMFTYKKSLGIKRPTSCNQEKAAKPGENNISTSSSENRPKSQTNNNNFNNLTNKKDDEMKIMEVKENIPQTNDKVMHGLIHLNSLKNVEPLQDGGFFIVCREFWCEDDAISTQMAENLNLNYMKTFPVVTNSKFLERVRNNHMVLELWQKQIESTEKLVGVTRLPLHQFYIAYRDAELTEHLSRQKLPVISIDGWSTIASPLSGELCGQIQVILAIGTENQIEYLKLSRHLMNTTNDILMTNRQQIPIPDLIKSTASSCTQTNDVEMQTCFSRTDEFSRPNTSITSKNSNQNEVANMLSAFIENLAQRLPIQSEKCGIDEPLVTSPHSKSQVPQMRKTADLLDNLQKALSQRPPIPQPNIQNNIIPPSLQESLHSSPSPQETENVFKLAIEIEQALNLPKLNISKKYGKRNKNRSNATSPPQKTEIEPSAYVTFEGYNLQQGMVNTVKSHEGIVYTTHVIEKSAGPVWNKKFEVVLPVDLMINDEKRFILKIWRKSNLNDVPKCRLLPAPMEDAVIGFTAIDLSVLLSGMPCILGWYNIMDFSGRCNGQIKVNIQPLEDVIKYKNVDDHNNFQNPLSIDVECGSEGSNASLSRALKRKFTELEEITQRLKARLFDVTGDENIDPDEEFEHDLNTEATEEEDDWPEEMAGNSRDECRNMNGALTMTTNTSSYTRPEGGSIPERNVSGCSFQAQENPSQLSLENLLQSHDIDTLINPNIFKNLINPSIVSSAVSTPMHDPYADLLNDESQSSSSDRIKVISKALEKATISDTDSNEEEREAPEGENMVSNDK